MIVRPLPLRWAKSGAPPRIVLIAACLGGIIAVQILARNLPDLRVRFVSDPPVIAREGSSFVEMDDTVNDNGSATSPPSTTRLYLSRVRARNPEMVTIGLQSIPPLAPGADYPGRITVVVPASVPVGFYFLLACSDDDNRISERNERNNCLASRAAVEIVPG